MRLWLKLSGAIASLLAVVAATAATAAAWDHNPQGIFHDLSGIHWNELGIIPVAWFLMAFVTSFIALFAIGIIISLLRRRLA